MLMKFALAAAVAYGAAVAFLAVFQRSFLYHPPRERLDEAALAARGYAPLDRPASGAPALWFADAAEPTGRVVVFLHGNAGEIAGAMDKVEPLRRAGHGVLLVEYPGFAGVAGSPTEDSIMAMAAAALARLAERGIVGRRLVLWGESLGTGVVVPLAAATRVGGVVLEAPFTAVVDRAQEIYWWTPARLLVRDRFDSKAHIGAIEAPLLVVHGERDTVTPATHGRRLLALAREPKHGVFYPQGGHTDLPEHGMTQAILDFIATLPRDGAS